MLNKFIITMFLIIIVMESDGSLNAIDVQQHHTPQGEDSQEIRQLIKAADDYEAATMQQMRGQSWQSWQGMEEQNQNQQPKEGK